MSGFIFSTDQSLMSLLNFRPKIKFYLFGIAARPTEKLAAQIILFAFQTILKKTGIAPEF
jgi:hypothetical protein